MATYKAIMRPALEYASSIWSPPASLTSINKLQVMQNAALGNATGCTQDTNIQHLHDETLILPIHEHLQLHASQYKQKTQHLSYPLHKNTTKYFNTPRLYHTICNNDRYTTNISTDPHTVTKTDIETNMCYTHGIRTNTPRTCTRWTITPVPNTPRTYNHQNYQKRNIGNKMIHIGKLKCIY